MTKQNKFFLHLKENYFANKSDFVILMLIYLLPFFLITGPFLSDLSVVIISIIFLLKTFYHNLFRKFFYNKFSIFFFIFYIYIVFLSFLSSNIILSLESSLFFVRFLVFIIAVKYIFQTIKDFNYFFLIILCSVFAIVCFDGFFQLFFNKNIFMQINESNRLILFTTNEWILGSYLSRLLPLIFACAFLNKIHNKFFIFLAFLFLILVDVLVFTSGERAALFYLMMSTLYILILASKFKIIRIVSIIFSTVIIMLFILSDPSIKHRMIDHTAKQIGIGTNTMNIFSVNHQAHYLVAYNMFLSKPLTGYGPKMFREVCLNKEFEKYKGCSTHPHNYAMQLLSETGILGFTFLIIIISIFWKSFKALVNKYIYNKTIYSDFKNLYFSSNTSCNMAIDTKWQCV